MAKKITITIPDEFENHFDTDKFKESLERLKADANTLAGNYEKELMDMLVKAFDESVESREDNLLSLYKRCRNELCLKCERYHNAHLGACDDCIFNFDNWLKY